MSTLGIGPVPPMIPGGGRHYSKPRRRAPERKEALSSPSYKIEQGAPVGAKNWLRALFQAGAIRLSVESIAGLLSRKPKEEEEAAARTTSSGEIYSGPTTQIFHEAVVLEKLDIAARREAEKAIPRRRVYLVPVMVLMAAGIFLLTVLFLDALFGTRSLAIMLSLVLR